MGIKMNIIRKILNHFRIKRIKKYNNKVLFRKIIVLDENFVPKDCGKCGQSTTFFLVDRSENDDLIKIAKSVGRFYGCVVSNCIKCAQKQCV